MMKRNAFTLFALALVGLALAAPAFAQAPDAGPPPGPGGGFPGGPPPGGGPGGFPGGPGGGFGGQRRLPFAFGTVSAVDAAASTITLTTQGGATQTLKVAPDAQIVTQQAVTVADLRVGDRVAVQGAPTGITASQVTAGAPPAGLPGAGGFGGGGFGGRGGNAAAGGGTAGGGAAGGAPLGFATASGTVKALPTAKDAHLTLSLSSDAVLYVKMAEGAKVVRWASVALSGIKSGDRVVASGQTGDDGTLTASVVGVNMPQGGPGGGFGGGFGGPGGGFGRYGAPGGGFGQQGGFGGRRRRGGGNGGYGGPGGGNGAPGGGFGGPGGPPPPGGDGGAPPPPGGPAPDGQ
ncbi:MAG: hypothetical protein JO250_13505 [Armatimonadetes bacterium]|nr:hypothetical protein [Armatimonadota bacterium]